MLKMLPDVVMISRCVAVRMRSKCQGFRKHEGLTRERESNVSKKDIMICISFMLPKSTFMHP